MRSRTLRTAFLALHTFTALQVIGQCANDNTLSGAAITVGCPGSISGGCILGGRYALVNVASGNIYTFSFCTATWNTFLTLYNNAGGVSVGFNDNACNNDRSAIQWTATFTGQLRVLVDRANCTPGGNPCAPLWITCSLNDDPCTSTLLTVGASCSNTTGSNDGATGGGVADPSCGGYSGGDVWYRFVAPASGSTTISTSTIGGSLLTDGAMAVYSVSSTCSSTFTQVACNDNSPLGGNMPYMALTALTSGNTYYVRFWENGNNAFGTFNICAYDTPPPANDDPCAATSLTVGTSCTNTTATNVSATNTAGIPAPSCGFYAGGDVWSTFIAPASGQVTVTASTVAASALTDGAMAVYSATACAGTYTELACNDDSPLGGLMPLVTLSGLTSGTTYYVRSWERDNNAFGQFNICVTTPAAVANDGPCTATTLTVGTTCSNTIGTTSGSTNTAGIPTPSCGNYLGNDVWSRAVAPASGNMVVTTSTVGGSSLTNAAMAAYSAASCGAAMTQVACNANSPSSNMPELVLTGLTAGTSYYFRVWAEGNTTFGQFNICAIQPPANDEPCAATSLTVGTSCTNTTATNVSATNTAGIPAPSCGFYAGGDVWSTFIAPASGQVTVTASTVAASALTDGAMAVYSATACAGTYTELACNDDSPLGGLMPLVTLSGLTSGTTYYVRSWERDNNAFGQFNICVTTPAAVANDGPCTATTLTVGTTCSNTIGTTSGSTNTAGIPTPSCGNYLGNDVWSRAVAPASGNMVVTTSTVGGSSLTNAAMAAYSATACGAAMTQVACNANSPSSNMPELALTGLTAGTTYYFRVWAEGNTTFGQFNICALEPPANDEPCGAISLTVGTSCSLSARTNVSATNTNAAVAPGCGSFTGSSRDVWYSFTAPTSGIAIIQSTAGTLTDGSMALYKAAACTASGLSLVQCSADDGAGAMPFLRFADLVPGDTYYIRYWGTGSSSGTFNLCVWAPALPGGNCVYFLEMFDSGENGWGTSAVQFQIDANPVTNYTVAAGNFYNCVMIGLTSGTLTVSYVNTGPNQSQNRYAIRQVPGGFGVHLAGPSPPSGIVLLETIDCAPPDPPNEDCRGSTGICDGQTFNDNPSGTGYDVDLRSTTFGCLAAAERQGTWYKFSPSSAGTVAMTISPSNAGDDYDFAIWGPETGVVCPPFRQPTRCSYSGATGDTGMRSASTDTTENSGGDKWVAPLTVTSGKYYVLYISNFSQSGLSFSLSWQLSNGASLDCTLLPVNFIDLQAELTGEAIEVRWSTASENEASHYIVERSTDAYEYVPIGSQQAMGTTTSLTTYSFLDGTPQEGLNYYRVQQVDMGGASMISPADYAIYRKASTEMVVFPNPAGDILFASFEMPEDDAVIWRILDSGGRLVEQDLYQGTKGNMLIDVPLERLASGSYTLLVNDARGLMNRSAHFMKY